MNKLILAATVFAIASCGGNATKEKSNDKGSDQKADSAMVEKKTEESEKTTEEVEYPYMAGAEFDQSKAISTDELAQKLQSFEGDSMPATVKGEIKEVCQKKGCWMRMQVGENEEMMVRFKDYEFFVPMNSAEHNTTIDGMVYYDTISVKQLKHYAQDAGAPADSLDKIIEPKVTLAFQASGVVVE
ncbi:DUF4920 domain-containing protein [Salibacter halophilus]|uniref:DUF4920 domain-containing protein n=1 Tax=Salibacter halophilus TaxID=1803916 RepID=A0A6N6M6K7_9FLAO|nr:DUF4920 domain-containing protein [Salibacter halophilus]KAB1065542.1 DUF4920 domain-containing protein [Salibacter halophilus]